MSADIVGKSPIVVLVEDSEAHRWVIARSLRRKGFSVQEGECADDILHMIGKADFENEEYVLVIDVRLPKSQQSVIEVGNVLGIQRVAQAVSEGRVPDSVPIIFISVYANVDEPCQIELKKHHEYLGPDRYQWLHKPFEAAYLVQVIKEELAARGN